MKLDLIQAAETDLSKRDYKNCLNACEEIKIKIAAANQLLMEIHEKLLWKSASPARYAAASMSFTTELKDKNSKLIVALATEKKSAIVDAKIQP